MYYYITSISLLTFTCSGLLGSYRSVMAQAESTNKAPGFKTRCTCKRNTRCPVIVCLFVGCV